METEITILVYFIFILAIGVYSSVQVKSHRDYYIAGKKAGILAVSGSLLATILGGSAILGTIELSQQIGWAALWFLFCASLGLLVLIPVSKYVNRYGNYTLPELLGHFYGQNAEKIASLIIPIAWLGIVAAQIIAAAKIISGLGYMDYTTAAVISGIIFIIYTVMGGQLSILKTDVLQAVLIIVGLLALLWFSQNNLADSGMESFKVSALFNSSFSVIDLLILILTYSVNFVVGPDIYSRVFCAKNEKTAVKSIRLVAIVLIPVSFALTWLGVFSLGQESNSLISFSQNLLPSWAYGLFIAALLSAVMSSADTTLLTSSLILNELITGDLEKNNSLLVTRIIVVIIGFLSIVIALYITSIIQSLLFALTFFSGAFVAPTLAGLLKWKVAKERVVIAMISGGLVAIAGKSVYLFYDQLTGNLIIIAAYIVNCILLFYPKRKDFHTLLN